MNIDKTDCSGAFKPKSTVSNAFQATVTMIIVMALAVLFPGTALQAQDIIAEGDVVVKGVTLGVDPANQTVPLNTPIKVNTIFSADSPEQARGMVVKGDLRGPGLSKPITLSTLPNHPFSIPGLSTTGDYFLENIRLERDGTVLLNATPSSVVIQAMNVVVTRVETRPLSLEEIRDKGIVITDKNFTAYSFSVGFKLESQEVFYQFPVIYTTQGPQLLPQTSTGSAGFNPIGSGSSSKVPFTIKVPQIDIPDISGTDGEASEQSGATIPGLLVFNNDIAFLNQFFSVMFIVSNNAPDGSSLGLKDLTATIQFPEGLREAETNPPRLTGSGIPVRCPGPDGKIGTDDDLNIIMATFSGMAEFLAEGLKTGRHTVKVDFTGTLTGIPSGDVEIKGSATGMVIVRQPEFSVTFSHPNIVRIGEEYDIYVTVTNTSKVDANLVSLTMPASRLVGTQLLSDETASFETIAPGESQIVKYHLLSLETGKVHTSAFAADGNVSARFELRAGVGEQGIPLSPDTLRLPEYAYQLPPNVIDYSVRLLGEAYSIATTPPGGLPEHLPYIEKNTVKQRVVEMADAGQRIMLGDDITASLQIFLLDWLGNQTPDLPFDILRRLTTKGTNLANRLAQEMAPCLQTVEPVEFHRQMASTCSYKAPFFSVMMASDHDETVASLVISDTYGNRLARVGGQLTREIPYGEWLQLETPARIPVDFAIVGNMNPADYSFKVDIVGTLQGAVDLSVVLPAADGTFNRILFENVAMHNDTRATITFSHDSSTYSLAIDQDGDDTPDKTVNGSVTAVVPPPLKLISAVQDCDAHPAGHAVALFFNRPVKSGDAGEINNYKVDKKSIYGAFIQPSGRVVLLGLDNPISPFVTSNVYVENLHDTAGNAITPAQTQMPVQAVIDTPGGIVYGKVIDALGVAVPEAQVHLVEIEDRALSNLGDATTTRSYTVTDANGNYQFDYVRILQNSFSIQVQDPTTGKVEKVWSKLQSNGQRFQLDIVMRGRGNISGRVVTADGTIVPNASIQAKAESNENHEFFAAQSDASGNFLIENVPVGRTTLIAVQGKMYGTAAAAVTSPGSTAVVDITVVTGKTGSVNGRVLLHDAVTPAQNAYVSVGNGTLTLFAARTDNEGYFSFPNVPVGTVKILAYDPYTNNLGGSISGQLAENQEFNGTIIFRGTGKIRGTVYDHNNTPVTGIVVAINGTPLHMKTDTNGEFYFENVPLGNHAVNAYGPDGQIATQPVKLVTEDEEIGTVLFFADTSAGSVSGKVFEPNGTTVVPGVDVFLCTGNYTAVGQARTGSDGSYRFDDVARGNYIVASVAGKHGTVNRTDVVYSNLHPTCNLAFRNSGSLDIYVLDSDGQTPAIAEVTVTRPMFKFVQGEMIGFASTRWSYNSGDQGHIHIEDVTDGQVSIEAKGAMGARAYKAVNLDSNGQNTVVNIVLQGTAQPGQIEATVFDYNGQAVESALVTLNASNNTTQNLSSDAQGKVIFTLIPEGSFTLEAQYNNYKGIRYGAMGYKGGVVQTTVTLKGKGKVTGTVKTPEGNPVNAASVILKTVGYPYETYETRCDTNGNFSFFNVSEGDISLTAFDDRDTQLGGRAEGQIVGHNATVVVDIKLESSGTVSGKVIAPDGIALAPNAQVILYHTRSANPFGFAVTGSQGEFSFENVPVGNVRVDVFDAASGRKGNGSGTIAANGDSETIDVHLEARGTVSGIFYSADRITPISGARVSIQTTGRYSFSTETNTAADGSFHFGQVGEGDFHIEARDPVSGLIGEADGNIQYEGQEEFVDVYSRAAGTVSGTVKNADGQPVTASTAIRLYTSDRTITAATAGDGTFIIRYVPLGQFSLRADKSDGDYGRASGVLNTNGEEVHLDVVLLGLGAVKVHIADEGDVTQVDMIARITYGSKSKETTAGSDQWYRFEEIPVGEFQVEAWYPNSSLNRRAYGQGQVVSAGQEVDVFLTVASAAKVSGTVYHTDGTTPVANARAKIAGNGFALYKYTDASGYFEFPAVKMGDFVLDIDGYNYNGRQRIYGSLTVGGGDVSYDTIVLDNVLPAVTSTLPADGSINVGFPLVQPVTLYFSEPLDINTLTGTNIRIYANNVNIAKQIDTAPDLRSITIIPSQPLQSFILYTVSVSTSVTDKAGNPFGETVSFSFTTADTAPPVVASMVPAHNSIEAPVDTTVTVNFDEAVDPNRFPDSNFRLSLNGTAVSGNMQFSTSNKSLTFTPAAPLQTDKTYTVTVQNAADFSGNTMTAPYTGTFTTRDTVPPEISIFHTTAPQDTVFVEGQLVDSFRVDSSHTDIAAVYFIIDNQLKKTVTAPAYLYKYNAPLIADTGSEFIIQAYAVDRAGNQGNTVSRTYKLKQDLPPAITLTRTGTGDVLPGQTIVCRVDTRDDILLSNVSLTAGPPANYSLSLPLTQESFTYDYSISVPADAAPGSVIVIHAEAKDNRGNVSSPSDLNVRIPEDAEPPQVSITTPQNGDSFKSSGSGSIPIEIAADVTDDVGVQYVDIFFDGQKLTRLTQPPYQVTYDLAPQTEDRDVIIKVDAADLSGKTASAQITVSLERAVDPDAPDVSFITPGTGSLVFPGENLSLRVKAEDENGIDNVEFFVNGTSVNTDTEAPYEYTYIIPSDSAPGSVIEFKAVAMDRVNKTNYTAVGTEVVAADNILPDGTHITESDATLDNKIIIIRNGSVTVSGPHTFQHILVKETGALTHVPTLIDSENQLQVTATGKIVVGPDARIHADNIGYLGGFSGGNTSQNGRTLGNQPGSQADAGGSYGGSGGQNTSVRPANPIYGSPYNPVYPGSGAGSYSASHKAGNGGGVIRLTAGQLVLDGSISAGGGNGILYSGGGSGGSIRIDASILNGSGLIRANGGNGGSINYGAGGGGRIAVYYSDAAQFDFYRITATGGMEIRNDGRVDGLNGAAGTIFLEKSGEPGRIIIDNRNIAGQFPGTMTNPASGKITALTDTVLTDENAAFEVNSLVGMKLQPNIDNSARFTVASNTETAITVIPNSGQNLTDVAAVGDTYRLTHNAKLVIENGDGRFDGNLHFTQVVFDSSRVIVNGTIYAETVHLNNDTVLSHSPATADTAYSLSLDTDELVIDETSKIDVTGLGYLGGKQEGNAGDAGYTFGNSPDLGSISGTGGSHGGSGSYWGTARISSVYGSLYDPAYPGSGGGANGSGSGSDGGGVVRIKTRDLILQGNIFADGDSISEGGYAGGSGAGGSIKIEASLIRGSGLVRANGGDSDLNAAGGGGRIAVYYETIDGFDFNNVTAYGGEQRQTIAVQRHGEAGSVYIKQNNNPNNTDGKLVINNRGHYTAHPHAMAQVTPATVTSLSPDGLTLENTGADYAPGSLIGMVLTPDIANPDVTAVIVANTKTSVTADRSLNGLTSPGKTYSAKHVIDGDIIVTNSSNTGFCGIVEAKNLTVSNNSILTHPTATTTETYSLHLKLSEKCTVDATSAINVNNSGYLGGYSGQNTGQNGRTVGNVSNLGSHQSVGGSHGGVGGKWGTWQVAPVYGSLYYPSYPGSGGGGNNGSPGGNGGGVLTLNAPQLEIAGTISANGGIATPANTYSGNGAGGSILVDVGTLTGAGTITADGPDSANYCAGGGGRIAIYYENAPDYDFSGISAKGGKRLAAYNPKNNGGAGTVYIKQKSQTYGSLVIDNGTTVTIDDSTPIPGPGKAYPTAIAANSIANGGAAFFPDSFTGMTINPDLSQSTVFTVTGNSATAIFTAPSDGDMSTIGSTAVQYTGQHFFFNLTIKGNARVATPDRVTVSGTQNVSDDAVFEKEKQ